MSRSNWNERYGSWALVTGASAGLGEEFALQLADKGMNVALVARRRERLESLSKKLYQDYHVDGRVIALDLTEPSASEEVAAAVEDLEIGLLINNAGFGTVDRFHKHEPGLQVKMTILNCVVPVELTEKFLPAMVERKRGGIIFVASTAAYQATPFFTVYGATKVFNLFMGEGLWEEYRRDGIDVLALSPGYTATEFHEVAGSSTSHRKHGVKAEDVVSLALQNLGRVPSVMYGRWNRLLMNLQRLLPRKVVIKLTSQFLQQMVR
ncbi:MAG: SDR family NAD(P)-dependent oxidoreductase [Fidelibacterota bacterium]